jgi:hypothetical protein
VTAADEHPGVAVRTLRCASRSCGPVEVDLGEDATVTLTLDGDAQGPIDVTGMLAELVAAGLEHPYLPTEATVPLGELEAVGHLVARHRHSELTGEALLGTVAAGIVHAITDALDRHRPDRANTPRS